MLVLKTYHRIYPFLGPDPLIRAVAKTYGFPDDRDAQAKVREVVSEISNALMLFDGPTCVAYMAFEIDAWAAHIEFTAVDTSILTDAQAAELIAQAIHLAECGTALSHISFSASPAPNDETTQRHLIAAGFVPPDEHTHSAGRLVEQSFNLPETRMGLNIGEAS
jgi:hypothetical protein